MRLDQGMATRGRMLVLQVLSASGAGLNSLIPMAVSPALPAMALHFGGGAGGELAAKLVMSSPALSTAIVSLFVGVIAQRVGFRRCLLAALAVYVVAGLAGLVVTGMPALIASRIAIGAAGAFIGTVTVALTGLFEPHQRDRLIGFASALGGGGSILALSIGGAMVDAAGWRAPFTLYLVGVPAFVATYYAMRLAPEPRGASGPAVAAAAERLPWRRLAPVYLLMVVMSLGFFTPGIHGPFLLTERGIASAATQGMLISVFAGTSAITAGSFGFIRPRLGERWIKVAMLVSLGGGLAGMAVATTIPLMAACLFVAGMGAGLATPQVTAMVLERVPPARHAHAIGGMFSAIFLGQFANPILLDPLQLAFGLEGMFAIFGSALAIAGFAMAFVASRAEVRVAA
ncbi:Predicted arabinose efflux permease, MFS family [Sphingomonas laterariae]|uniref:Predicted arabinose efflux permease, MFS family n=1 Tax=Edaphosphingomonas laterariae TaxID=861865 RepID=A0A239HDP2_9SPHN|nr:MFS transporter [Sphingomonas laterariae]SNS78374.1 Predicted arabinose efflux permease, MFS family [Sphingomonas laterariae]